MNEQMKQNDYSTAAVIPAYNSGAYIKRSIDSVLAQTLPVDEVIVIDDGSTDNTADVVRAYGEKVRYIYQKNAGPGAARNTGIKAAASNWIAFLDADDQWLPDKHKLQIELLKQNPDLLWCSGNYFLTTQKQHHPYPRSTITESTATPFFTALRKGYWGCTDTMLIKTQVFYEVGFFDNQIKKLEDLDLWLRIAYLYPKLGIIHQPISIYYLDVQGSLIKSERDILAHQYFLDKHIQLTKDNDMYSYFLPCAKEMLKKWIRGLLFQARGKDIQTLLVKNKPLLTNCYILIMRFLILSPNTTSFCLNSLSKIFRLLRIIKKPNRKC